MSLSKLEGRTIGLYDVKDQLRRHVYNRSEEAFREGDRARDAVQSIKELEARRKSVREKLLASLGGLPSADTPLNPKVAGVIQADGFRIEKIVFESRPGAYVTSNLYVPDGLKGPRGAVVFVCGHHDMAKHHPEYQTVCQTLVMAGLIVFAVDPIGQGERMSYWQPDRSKLVIGPGTGEHEYAGAQCWPLGQGIAKYFVHDMIRAVDYLSSRPEVDPGRIGITGNSGGGTQTALAMMCEPRIAAAAPATFIMSRGAYLHAGQAQDAEQVWPGMSAWGFDHEDILLAMAPRPVLVLAVQQDFFPIEGTRRSVSRAARFWDMYGQAGGLELFEDNAVHQYTLPLARRAAVFFAEHLLGMQPPEPGQIALLEPSQLWCTAEGQVRGEFPEARGVYEENVARLQQLEQKREKLPVEKRRAAMVEWLDGKVRGPRTPADLNPRTAMAGQWNELSVESVLWWSQPELFSHAYVFRDYRFAGEELPVAIGLWEGGTARLRPHIEWIREACRSGRMVMVLDVTGEGALTPNPINGRGMLEVFGTIHKLAADLLWLDDSLAAMRTYDVLRALDMAEHMTGVGNLHIRTYGRYNLYAQLAAALDARITHLTLDSGMASVADWVGARHYNADAIAGLIVPGMLEYGDLPDLPGPGPRVRPVD